MEKLIKLINKRQEEKHSDGIYLPVVAYRDWIFWSDSDCLSSVMDETYLISKSCRFIQWLVENDKIDFSNIKRIILNYEVEDNEELEYYDLDFASKKETLLMLLSISDEPIEDLISYLK